MTAAFAPPSAAAAPQLAAALVCSCEGFRASPYRDTAGVFTIGYGTTRCNGHPVTADTPPVTEADARELMEVELEPLCAAVTVLLTGEPDDTGPPFLTPDEVAACASLAYNIGLGAFRGSTILHLWLQGDVAGAAQHFLDWRFDHDPVTHALVEVPGLLARRKREIEVFLGEW